MQLLLNELADDYLDWAVSFSLVAVLCSIMFPFPMKASLGLFLAALNWRELSLDPMYLCPIISETLLFNFLELLLNLYEHCFSMHLFLVSKAVMLNLFANLLSS